MIADQTGPLAMAGIFGGQASGVDAETTKDVILEAAFFAPLAIADVQDNTVYTPILHIALNVVLILRYNVTQWNVQQHCY